VWLDDNGGPPLLATVNGGALIPRQRSTPKKASSVRSNPAGSRSDWGLDDVEPA